MSPNDPITTLFRHHLWANLRLLERCAALSDEQLEATMSGAFGSIGNTLQHIVMSEQSYFSRRTGSGLIEWAPTIAADDTVPIDWDGTPREVPKSILLTQAINHATEHRAQIMAMLTQLGIEPPDLQGWQYFDELP
jgi:uncharacterized damage-inducible protein DinB